MQKDVPGIPEKVLQYFDHKGILWEIEKAPHLIPEAQKIRTVILGDMSGTLMIAVSVNRLFDYSVLCRDLNRELELVSAQQRKTIFRGSDPEAIPPLPECFRLSGILDKSILQHSAVYFEAGIKNIWVKVSQSDFEKMHEHSWQGDFSEAVEVVKTSHSSVNSLAEVIRKFTPRRIRDRIQETFELPAIPPMAEAILRLRVDPNADSKALAKVIENDPSLASQLISWAKSPYYGTQGKVTSVEDAIIKVLGFDLVMNLALGIAIGRAMVIPVAGPLGLRSYWQHSVYTAALVEALVNQIPVSVRPIRGLAYLSGLLHNFGYLLLGQIFLPQFQLLSKYVILNPGIEIRKIEQHVLEVGHEQIGSWLMQAWNMPEELITAVRLHHDEEYTGPYAVYSTLVLVANRMLWTLGIGDAGSSDIPARALEILSLRPDNLDKAMEAVTTKIAELDSLAKELSH